MLPVAHQLETAERRWPGTFAAGRRAASDDRCHGLDGNDVGLAVHELYQQPRELAELRAFGIGAAALGDFTGCVRDRRRRHLEQLGDRVADAGGWCATGPADLADRLLDSFEEIRERGEIGERGEAAERLQRLQDLLQRIMRHRIGAYRPARAIERAGNRGALARDEGARARVEAHRLRRSNLGRGTPAELLELAGQRLRLGGIGVAPARRLAHEDLEIIDRANCDLLRRRVPGAPALAHAARERLEPHRRARDPLLAGHQRAAAERARQAYQLLGCRRGRGLEQGIEPVEILPRLEGEEVRHAEWLSHGWNNISRLGARWPWCWM